MLPEERQILGELRRHEIWEEFGEDFPAEAFDSKDAKRLRRALDHLHKQETGIIPLTHIKRYTGDEVQLETPLPVEAARELLKGKLIRAGIRLHLERLDREIEEGAESSQNGLPEALSGLLEWGQEMLSRNGGSSSSPVLSVEALVREERRQEVEPIPTYLHQGLDEHLEGGVGRGEVCCLMLPYGRGKSTLLQLLSYRAARAGKRVLFISCENTKRQDTLRWVQVHKQEKGKRKTWPPTLFYVYHEHVSAKEVASYAQKQAPLDLLIVDYYGNMAGADTVDPVAAKRSLDVLKHIALLENLVLWTAIQGHDPPRWQKRSTREQLYGGKTVGHLSDLFLGGFVNLDKNELILTNHKRRGAGRAEIDFLSYFNVDTAELREM